MKKIFGNPIYAILLAILCAALWGSAVPTVKMGYQVMALDTADTYGKMLFAGIRFFIASIALFGFAVFGLKLDVRIKSTKMLGKVTALGLMQTTFQYSLMYIGVSFTTAAKSSILTSTGIFFIAIIAHFIYKNDKLTPNKVAGLFAGLVGIIIASLGKSGGLNFEFALLGEGLIIGYQLCSAIASIFVKNFSRDHHPVVLTVWQMFIGSSILIIIGLIGFDFSSITYSPQLGFLLLYLSAASAASYTIWNILLKYNKAAEISIFKFVTPVAGTLLSAAFLGDHLDYKTLIALVFVSLGIICVYYKRGTKAAAEEEEEEAAQKGA